MLFCSRTRTREVTTQPSCDGSACPLLSEREECRVDTKIDCVMAPWTEWSVCNNDCGNGTAFRSRTMQTKAYCGGADCADTRVEDEKSCYREVNKDCEVSNINNIINFCFCIVYVSCSDF